MHKNSVFTRLNVREAGEQVELVKCLLHKHEESLDPQLSCKNWRAVACLSYSIGERPGPCWPFSLADWTSEFQVQQETPQHGGEQTRKTRSINFWLLPHDVPTHLHTPAHTHMNMYTCIGILCPSGNHENRNIARKYLRQNLEELKKWPANI